MNQTQSKYAQNRLIRLNNEKSAEITKKYTVPAVSLTVEEKIIAIKNGDYTVTPQSGYREDSLDARLRFQGNKASYITDEGVQALKDLTKAYNTAMDELVLGDEVAALALLKAFESKEF